MASLDKPDLSHRKQRSRQEEHQYSEAERAALALEFYEKNALLSFYGTEVSAHDFYRDMFPEGCFEEYNNLDQQRPNGIVNFIKDANKPGWKHNLIIFDDLKAIEEVQGQEFVIVSPVAYSGRRRLAKNAYQIFGLCLDLDNVGTDEIKNLFYQMQNDLLPLASYVVNSGTGLHIYYLFEEPLPAYSWLYAPLGQLKDALVNQIWNKYTSRDKVKQYQSIFQGYRVPGTQTKFGGGCMVTAFKTGGKVLLTRLNDYVDPRDQVKFDDLHYHNLKEAAELWPEWIERRQILDEQGNRNKEPKEVGSYKLTEVQKKRRRAWYENWKERIRWDAKDGNRHNFMCVLFNYAMKAEIPLEEAEADALEMVELLDLRTEKEENHFTEEDVLDAEKFYNHRYIKMGRKGIKRLTGVELPKTRRNGQTQKDHLEEARAVRDLRMKRQGRDWRNTEGRPTAEEKIRKYIEEHPNCKKADIIRDLNLSKPTVYKWWHVIVENKPVELYRKKKEITTEEFVEEYRKHNKEYDRVVIEAGEDLFDNPNMVKLFEMMETAGVREGKDFIIKGKGSGKHLIVSVEKHKDDVETND